MDMTFVICLTFVVFIWVHHAWSEYFLAVKIARMCEEVDSRVGNQQPSDVDDSELPTDYLMWADL